MFKKYNNVDTEMFWITLILLESQFVLLAISFKVSSWFASTFPPPPLRK